ncbi:MAG: polyketide antibiotic transporter [Pseudolysinimonas sp.]
MVRILLQQIRRDRLTLPIWILGTVALLAVSATAVATEFGDADGRRTVLSLALATPALLALRGIPNGDSLGSTVHFQSFAFLAVTIGLMNTFLATRHGRADEEKGRRELVAATPAFRLSPPIATLLLGLIANGLFVVVAKAGYEAAGLDASGALLSAVALGVTGLAFLGISMLAGELTATSRGANGIGVVVVLASYAFRAAGDALGTPDIAKLTLQPAWPSWLSPIGWGQQTLAFTDDNWAPVAWIAVLAVVTATVALIVHSRRELGASLLPERAGRATARAALRSPFALAWWLQSSALLAWTVGSALLGVALGSLVTAISGSDLGDTPAVAQILQSLGHTQGDLGRALIPALMTMVGVLAAAAGVQAVLRMRDEESDGRAETVLTTPHSRAVWLLSFTAVGAASVVVVLLATGLAAVAGFAALGEADDGWLSLGQGLAQGPAALTFVGLAAVLMALLPRAAVALSWGIFAVGVGIGLFGGLLGLDDDVQKISPFANVPALPSDDWVPTILIGAIALVLGAIAALLFRRRDLVT